MNLKSNKNLAKASFIKTKASSNPLKAERRNA
jgi:hypothetical protein